MSRAWSFQLATATLAAVSVAGCGAAVSAPGDHERPAESGPLTIVAEGPCARLSISAVGSRRLVVYGDTGYDLELWVPGERLAAAQSFVELSSDGAWLRDDLERGLVLDERGYVPARVELGGDLEGQAWARLVTTRYAPHGTGKLFERSAQLYARAGARWEPIEGDGPADLPASAAGLPDIPSEGTCPSGEAFEPLAWATSQGGGLFSAGRCQPAAITPSDTPHFVVVHGAPGSRSWTVTELPQAPFLTGHVNGALFARSEKDAWFAAYEPFARVDARHDYLAHWDGAEWRHVPLELAEGLMSIAETADGTLYLAAGRGLYRRDTAGTLAKVPLPVPRFVRGSPELHVHAVHVFGGQELWVEASYKVRVASADGKGESSAWASVLYGPSQGRHYHCDARQVADEAFSELE